MKLVILKDDKAVHIHAAKKMIQHIKKYKSPLICLSAGHTMPGVYRELIRSAKENDMDLTSAFYIILDEWLGLGYETKGSSRQILFDEFFKPAGIADDRIEYFNGLESDTDKECKRVTGFIETHGRISLAVIGIGLNGHIGFNEPYTRQNNICITVKLDKVTKQTSSKYFGQTTDIETGITVSMNEILRSREIIAVITGHEKSKILYKTLNDMPSMAVPSSLLQLSKNCTVIADKAAASQING